MVPSGFRQLLVLSTLLVFGAGSALAQSQFGSVVGTIADSSGAPIPGVAVRAINEASALGFSTVTGGSGEYVIGGLLPGSYTVEAKKDGFASNKVQHINVQAGVTSKADVAMSPGAVSQTVVVSAESAQLATESATVQGSLSPEMIQNPTFIQATQSLGDTLLAWVPGQVYMGGRLITSHGSRGYDRRETLDGAVFGVSNTSGLTMPRETVSDVQAVGLVADAEHQTSNSSEMFTSKGTNSFHGAVWNEIQNAALNQLSWTAAKGTRVIGTPTVGIGYKVGGPVYIPKLYHGRDKTFFFSTWQKYWAALPQPAQGTAASDAMRAGNFQGVATIKDPQTGLPFANSIIPPERISTLAQGIYNQYFPSVPGAYQSPDFPTSTTYFDPFWDFFARVDHQFGQNDLLSVTYLYNTQITRDIVGAEIGGFTNGPTTTGFSTVLTHLHFFNVSENHIFTPRMMNEASFGARMGVTSNSTAANDGNTVLSSMGLPTTPNAPAGITGGPTITFAGMSGLNFDAQNASDARIWTFRDNLSRVWSRSNLKVGFEYVRHSSFSQSYSNLYGTYNFSGLFTGNPFADFLLGLPSSTSRALPPGPLNKEQQEWGAYASETVHLMKNLTLNAALRIENETPAIETHGKYYTFDLATGQVVVPNQSSIAQLNPGLSPAILASIVPASAAKFPEHLVNPFWYYSPRLGLDYQVRNNMVVRAGFGIYSSLLNPGSPTGGPFTPGVTSSTNTNICNGGTCTPAFTLDNPFPSGGAQAVTGLAISGTNPHIRAPENYQWQLSVERQLSPTMTARVTYAGAHLSQLTYQRNVDLPQASTIPFTAARLIYPLWNGVTYADSGGNQSFNGLEGEIKRQLSHSFTFDSTYSWNRCLTDDDESGMIIYGGTGPLGNTIEDPYDRSRDKGNCEGLPAQTFVTTFVGSSPFGRNGRWLKGTSGTGSAIVNNTLGGWTMSWVLYARTGHHYTPLITGIDAANTGQTLIRPDRTCSGVAHPKGRFHFFDPSCFVAPPSGRYGNAGTGIIDGLGAFNFDAGMYKYFTFSQNERVPRFRFAVNSTDPFGIMTADIEYNPNPALIINAPATVARANQLAFFNGTSANLGAIRHIYFELRLEW